MAVKFRIVSGLVMESEVTVSSMELKLKEMLKAVFILKTMFQFFIRGLPKLKETAIYPFINLKTPQAQLFMIQTVLVSTRLI